MEKLAIIIYSKDECCLCDEAKDVIERTLQRMKIVEAASVTVIDISTDASLYEKYQNDIPVITINGDFAFRYKVHPVTLEKKLLKAMGG